MLWLKLVLLSIFVFSCTSTEKQEQNLDIEITKLPVQSTEADMKQLLESGKSLRLAPEAKIEWEKFFRPPPSVKERGVLAAKLRKWKDVGSATEYLRKGRTEVVLGKLTAAEASFRQSLRLEDENPEVYIELVQLYLRKDQHEKSFDYLGELKQLIDAQAIKDSKLVFRYRFSLALGYIARGDKDKGHSVLSDLIGLDKTFIPGYVALASSYVDSNKLSVAKFIVKRGVDRGGEDASLLNILGVIEQREGQRTKAKKFFDKALAKTPTYAPALVNRANILMSEHGYEAAELNLLKATKYYPDYIPAYVSLGICYKKMGRLTASKSAFERAIELNPNSASARFNLGVLVMKDFKQPNLALRLFHEVLQTDAEDADLKRLASLYIEDIRENNQP